MTNGKQLTFLVHPVSEA